MLRLSKMKKIYWVEQDMENTPAMPNQTKKTHEIECKSHFKLWNLFILVLYRVASHAAN